MVIVRWSLKRQEDKALGDISVDIAGLFSAILLLCARVKRECCLVVIGAYASLLVSSCRKVGAWCLNYSKLMLFLVWWDCNLWLV